MRERKRGGGGRGVETGEEKTCLQDSLVMFCGMSVYVCVGGGGGGVERERERERGKTFGTFTKCKVVLRSFKKICT